MQDAPATQRCDRLSATRIGCGRGLWWAVIVGLCTCMPGGISADQRVVQSADQYSTDRVRFLIDDSTALLHRLQLIDTAQNEVLLSAYEIGDDRVALKVLAGLRSAARRGVCTRLIVDGHAQNNRIPKAMMEYLILQGVEIREHMPDVRYKVEIGRQRMHDKLLIVDGQRLVMGGRNVRADYYGLAKINFLDREVYLVGPTARHARSYFLARWNASTSGVPSLDREEKPKTRQQQALDGLNDMPRVAALQCAERWLDLAGTTTLPVGPCVCRRHSLECDCEPLMQIACIRFLHDIPERPKDEPAAIAHQLCEAISKAEHSVVIETPYLALTENMQYRLAEVRRRGVQVRILTNSLETTNHVIVHAQYANQRRWLLDEGIELWELKGERHLHAKAMVIDHRWSMMGSYNFDALAETRNSEVALLIDDCQFAAALSEQIRCHQNMSQQVPIDEPLIGFDERNNDVDEKVLREARIKRLISPWIKKYL